MTTAEALARGRVCFGRRAWADAFAGLSAADRELHGVPAAIKDLFDHKPGWPATFGGIRALRDLKPD